MLKTHPEFNEKWVQEIIANDPSILGLGDLILKDKERMQPKAGRLDLLLQDVESNRRYEVEIQLGPTDEGHIIRTIEYWDIERKRYPAYDHCAVIVAEDITSRFLNIMNLFNGSIPLIAIQMNAIKMGNQIALVFTTVVDELTLGLDEEDEYEEPTDRNYWENKIGSKETVSMVDKLLVQINTFAPGFELKYNKYYIGLSKDGRTKNFVTFIAKKKHLLLYIHLKQSDDIQGGIDESGMDFIGYNKYDRAYRFRITKGEIEKNKDFLTGFMNMAYEYYEGL